MFMKNALEVGHDLSLGTVFLVWLSRNVSLLGQCEQNYVSCALPQWAQGIVPVHHMES